MDGYFSRRKSLVIFILILISGSAVTYLLNRSTMLPESKKKPSSKHSKLSDISIPQVRVTRFDCRKLFAGNLSETKKASLYARDPVNEASVQKMAQNCKMFISTLRYMMKTLREEENEFPIAFNIIMFKEVDHFERLLRAIYRPQNFYCVHVDKRAKQSIQSAVKEIVKCFPNVFLPSRHIAVVWGEFGALEAELQCMKDLLKKSKKWKYFINLTGQEFPLKTNWDIVKILKVLNGSNNTAGTIEHMNHVKDRLEKAGNLTLPITLAKGSTHMVAKRKFIEYLIYNETAQKFNKWINVTVLPEETFFNSLKHSPQLKIPGAYLGIPKIQEGSDAFIARYKSWYSVNSSYHGTHVRNVCIFGVGDLPVLSTRRHLFANKFYAHYQSATLDCLEELHYNRTRDEYLGLRSFNTSFYQNLPYVRNHI